MIDLDSPVTQAQFGEIVGVTQQAVSDFIKVAALGPGVPLGVMLQAYCGRLREQAAGRGSDGELDLVQERAWLAREQRIAQALKNATTRKEFAPIGRLSEVLAAASGSVAAKLDALPGLLKKVAPELSESARDAIAAEIAKARNEWVNDTQTMEIKPDPWMDDPDDEAEEQFVEEGAD